ncbi:MAG TPA: hypothetical protein VKD69_02950 [Vicinamibacterales bacterium]|nr:hypothetical protein [Vicinamibacterales bacterium]
MTGDETDMDMKTYVNFPGSCAEAFRYYEKHLGGKIRAGARSVRHQLDDHPRAAEIGAGRSTLYTLPK